MHSEIKKRLNKAIIPRKKLEKIYKKDKTIISLIRSSAFQYNMLIALQQQILCLEAKIKILEEILKRR